jgi:hypothetical protein
LICNIHFYLTNMDQSSDSAPSITNECFIEWRSPKFGTGNPSKMTNPLWSWLVASRMNAYQANELLKGPSPFDAGPMWCFDRFGQSTTEIPHGRTIYIGGEHEDHYDPDFYIYNDVVLTHPDGQIEIYGYPKEVFPATDFHTATLLSDRIVIIGCLGYLEQRVYGTTQVIELMLDTFAIRRIATTGDSPGWIHSHTAALSNDGKSIVISGGLVDLDGSTSLYENIDEWELNLLTWNWTRKTQRNWQRWVYVRKDRKRNKIWNIRQALWCRDVKWEEDLATEMQRLSSDIGYEPNLDIVPSLYRPDNSINDLTSEDDEHGVFRIEVDGIVMRFKEDGFSIQAIIEGVLSDNRVKELKTSVLEKLTLLENTEWEIE